jgi:hypothetical protein
MNIQRTASAAFTVEFENEQELRDEHRDNLSIGAFRVPTAESVGLNTLLLLTIRGPWGGELFMQGRVVASLPDGIALAIEENADEILARLLVKTVEDATETSDAEAGESESSEKNQNTWDRVRGLSQMQKILLAAKADRSERALLIQDNDPRVLLSVLRNPRLTVEEVGRIGKSSFLTYQVAEVIMNTGQWMANLDVRLALIRNPKTPQAFGLRILPALPESEVKAIARGGMNMALKQAALKRLQGKP